MPKITFSFFQPPKKSAKKKGKKKSAKAKTPTIVDGISTEEMSKEQVCDINKILVILVLEAQLKNSLILVVMQPSVEVVTPL